MKKIKVTEEMKIHEQWYKDAKKQTLETLPGFLKGLTENYIHDYGTIVHAISAGAIATAWAMDSSDQGGITGFQAGAVMWRFIQNWMYSNNKTGLKLIDYDKMLYPQYKDDFARKISRSTWEDLQNEAKMKISENSTAHERVIEHWKSIAAGIIPWGFTIGE
jgi:hypothetical protein